MRYATKLQTSWDWRAAANFMFGGGGSALLLAAALVESTSPARHVSTLVGMLLMGAGLAMVWLELGRPWRAANVMLKPQNSWMTREAYMAGLAFLLAAGSMMAGWPWLVIAAGLTGAAFLYCQARILHAAKGIPAWREPSLVWLIIATGLTEGAALLLLILTVMSETSAHLSVLPPMLALRFVTWQIYRNRLLAAEPPAPVIAALPTLSLRFISVGHALPLLLIAAGYFLPSLGLPAAAAASLCALLSGWDMKFALITRLAHAQGYGLGRLKRGHPLRLGGHQTVCEASTRLRKTRETGMTNNRSTT